jgi:micrococcal nuclease
MSPDNLDDIEIDKALAAPWYSYKVTVHRVIDGDTVDMIVDYGFGLKQKQRIRLLHVDTPERGHEKWGVATETLRMFLEMAAKRDPEGKDRLHLVSHKTGKYGRWLGEIYSLDMVINITADMEELWPYQGRDIRW